MVGVTIAGQRSVPGLILHVEEAYFGQRHLAAATQTRRERPLKPSYSDADQAIWCRDVNVKDVVVIKWIFV